MKQRSVVCCKKKTTTAPHRRWINHQRASMKQRAVICRYKSPRCGFSSIKFCSIKHRCICFNKSHRRGSSYQKRRRFKCQHGSAICCIKSQNDTNVNTDQPFVVTNRKTTPQHQLLLTVDSTPTSHLLWQITWHLARRATNYHRTPMQQRSAIRCSKPTPRSIKLAIIHLVVFSVKECC